MKLTTTTVRSLNLPPGVRERTFFDSALPGFGLRLRASGVQRYVVQYKIGSKNRRLVLGSPAELDLGKARDTAKDLLAAVRLGRDPAGEKAAAHARTAETFGALLPRFLERQRARLKPRSLEEVERHLVAHAKPLHGRPIEAIDRRSIATRLAEIAEASGPAASNRVRASLSAYFTWAAREGYIESNPVAFTNKSIENGSRDRVLADDELRAIWLALGDDQYGAILRLLMLTGARRDEIASLHWAEIDLSAATITLPPARTKNRREHVIPLSAPTIAILATQPRRIEPNGTARELVFGYGSKGWQDWSGSKADLDARIAAARKDGAFEWRLHDFRRSLSTALHERFGVPPHVIEVILGHVSGHQAGVAGVYNKAIYLDERRHALARWCEHIEHLVSKRPKAVKTRRRK
jgi:integrase